MSTARSITRAMGEQVHQDRGRDVIRQVADDLQANATLGGQTRQVEPSGCPGKLPPPDAFALERRRQDRVKFDRDDLFGAGASSR